MLPQDPAGLDPRAQRVADVAPAIPYDPVTADTISTMPRPSMDIDIRPRIR